MHISSVNRDGMLGKSITYNNSKYNFSFNQNQNDVISNRNEFNSRMLEYLTFAGNISHPKVHRFRTCEWDKVKAMFDEVQMVDGKREYVNVVDFINNGKNSKLAQNIPILQASFGYCKPFNLRSEETTVGKHITGVVSHLYYDNEEFKTLPEKDKKLLIKAAVFHDIGKVENKISRTILSKPNFEEIIRQRIKDYEIFNEPSDYIKRIRNFFENNPSEKEMILHNNIHRIISADLVKKYIIGKPEHKEELAELEFLILNHENLGKEIDRYKNNLIDENTFNELIKTYAKEIPSRRLLKLVKIFHLSDGADAYKNNPKYYSEFKILLNKAYQQALLNIDNP